MLATPVRSTTGPNRASALPRARIQWGGSMKKAAVSLGNDELLNVVIGGIQDVEVTADVDRDRDPVGRTDYLGSVWSPFLRYD
jgi:hypothetical protein